jgi:hypothetical protein
MSKTWASCSSATARRTAAAISSLRPSDPRSTSKTTTSRSSPSTSAENAAPQPERRAGWLRSALSSTSWG